MSAKPLAYVVVTTACLFLIEWGINLSSNYLEKHDKLKGLVLLLETLAHATTGFLFWAVSTTALPEPKTAFQLLETSCYAALFAVLVDLDHFIAAGSLSIKAARSLTGRPFLHWTGGLLLFTALLYVASRNSSVLTHLTAPFSVCPRIFPLLSLSWVVLVAWTSHQMRDSLRRGLWMWPPPKYLVAPPHPLRQTPPLPLILAYPLALLVLLTVMYFSMFRLDLCTPVFSAVHRRNPNKSLIV